MVLNLSCLSSTTSLPCSSIRVKVRISYLTNALSFKCANQRSLLLTTKWYQDQNQIRILSTFLTLRRQKRYKWSRSMGNRIRVSSFIRIRNQPVISVKILRLTTIKILMSPLKNIWMYKAILQAIIKSLCPLR